MTPEETALDFAGLVVVVTGAGRGLGRRYATDLAGRGARVVVCARRPAAAEEVVADIHHAGGTATAAPADPTRAIELTLATHGRIDALIVNAGNVRDRSFGRMSDDEWADVLTVHLDGARRAAAAVWPTMLAQASGRIVLTGSGAGLHGNRGQANYATAKAGVIGLAKSLALEGGRHGVGVNVVAPMAVTDMTDAVFDDAQRDALTAARVSPLVLALAHPSCPLSGQVIEAGGGWAAAVRWQRAAGIRLGTPSPTPEDFASRWSDIARFDEHADHPTSIADSLSAAVGTTERP